MAVELYAEAGGQVAITVTPGAGGILQVFMDGEKVLDKADEGGKYPELTRVKELRATLRQRLAAVPVGGDG